MVKCCVPCRARKVKCDGRLPQCKTCFKSRLSLNCVYETQPAEASTLSKGEACFPCRRNKRRCDATRPSCSTCKASSKEQDCTYELPNNRRYQRDSQGKLHEIQVPLRKLHPLEKPLSVPTPIASDLVIIPSNYHDLGQFQVHDFNSFADCPSLKNPHPPFDSMWPQTIIPNPTLSLECSDDPLAFALSEVSPEDMNMKFRVLFLSRQRTYGLYFTHAKQQAILRGDESGTIIHPFFINLANLCGAQYYQERLGYYCVLPTQAGHLLSTLEAFASMSEENDPFSLAQASWTLAVVYSHPQAITVARRYLKNAMDIVWRNNIRFVPISTEGDSPQLNTMSSLPEFSEVVHERMAFLANLVHSEVFVFLVAQPGGGHYYRYRSSYAELNGIYSDIYLEPNVNKLGPLCPDLEMQFRYDLPEAYPILFKLCTVILRTRSMILAKDASNIISWFYEQSSASSTWMATCHTFMSHLRAHIGILTEQLAETKEMHDEERSLSLCYTHILSLTTLAQISYILSLHTSNTPIAEAFRDRCSDALKRIMLLIEELGPADLRSFDPFLGIYWIRAIKLFKQLRAVPSTAPNNQHSYPGTLSSVVAPGHSFPPGPIPETDADVFVASAGNSAFDLLVRGFTQLTHKCISNRYIPGTMSLCEKLAAVTPSSRRK